MTAAALPEAVGSPLYVLELPGLRLPALNVILRQHHRVRQRRTLALAWEVRGAFRGALPAAPLPRARIEIDRRSLGAPDTDGLYSSLKSLLDVLQPMSKRHPYGLGVIQDDAADRLAVHPRAVRVRSKAEVGVTVRIWPLPDSPSPSPA